MRAGSSQRDRSEMGTQNILWPTHCRAAFRDLHYRLQGEIALAAKAKEWARHALMSAIGPKRTSN